MLNQMKPQTQIRIGMISVAVIWWSFHQLAHYFKFGRYYSIFYSRYELSTAIIILVPVLLVGEIGIRYELSNRRNQEKIYQLEAEKKHIFNIGMFGNSKEVKNKVIIMGQTSQLMKDGRIDINEGSNIIYSNAINIIEILEVQLTDLEKQIK